MTKEQAERNLASLLPIDCRFNLQTRLAGCQRHDKNGIRQKSLADQLGSLHLVISGIRRIAGHFGFAVHPVNGPGKHPGVKAQHRGVSFVF